MDTMWIISILLQMMGPWMSLAMDERKEVNQGIIFLRDREIIISGDKWIICMDVGLDSFYTPMSDFRQAIAEIQQLKISQTYVLNIVAQKTVFKETERMLSETDILVNQLTNRLTVLSPKRKQRGKRGLIDVGGSILKFVFGTMDKADFDDIDYKIRKLQTQNTQVVTLLEDQITYFTKLTENQKLNDLRYQELQNELGTVYSRLRGLEEDSRKFRNQTEKWLVQLFSLNAVLNNLQSILSYYRTNVTQFISALDLLKDGKLSTYLLTPKELKENLEIIQRNLPREYNLVVPLDDTKLFTYYDIIHLEAVIINSTILRVFIHVPLTSYNQYFTLFKVWQAPVPVTEQIFLYIKAESDYVAITADNEFFVPLNHFDIEKCRQGVITFCTPTREIRKKSDKNCLVAAYVGNAQNIKENCEIVFTQNITARFYRAISSDFWVYSVKEEKLHIQCSQESKDGSTDKYVTVKGTGYLQLPSGCRAQSDTFILFSNMEGKSTMINQNQTVRIPPYKALIEIIADVYGQKNFQFNKSEFESSVKNIYETGKSKLTGDYTVKIAQWREQLKVIKLKEMSNSSSPIISVMGSLLGICVIIIIVIGSVMIIKVKSKRREKNKERTESPGIELSEKKTDAPSVF